MKGHIGLLIEAMEILRRLHGGFKACDLLAMTYYIYHDCLLTKESFNS